MLIFKSFNFNNRKLLGFCFFFLVALLVVQPVAASEEAENWPRFEYSGNYLDLAVGMVEDETATWIFYGDGEKLEKIKTNDVEFDWSEYGNFEDRKFEIKSDNYSDFKSINWEIDRKILLPGEEGEDKALIGEIPAEIGNLDNLESLALFRNELSGEIPPEIGDLDNLKSLRLDNNKLSGEIPSEIGDLTNLTRLYLDNNNLSGEIPSEIENLTNLWSLEIQNNDLDSYSDGSFSTQSRLGNNTDLYDRDVLDISNNNFPTKDVDEVLSDLVESLELENRLQAKIDLTGNKPPSKRGMNNLQTLEDDGWDVSVTTSKKRVIQKIKKEKDYIKPKPSYKDLIEVPDYGKEQYDFLNNIELNEPFEVVVETEKPIKKLSQLNISITNHRASFEEAPAASLSRADYFKFVKNKTSFTVGLRRGIDEYEADYRMGGEWELNEQDLTIEVKSSDKSVDVENIYLTPESIKENKKNNDKKEALPSKQGTQNQKATENIPEHAQADLPFEQEGFISCLAENDLVIYGVKTCPACQELVESLGGYDIVDPIYVECSEQGTVEEQKQCKENKETNYVPEIQINGELYEGSRDPEALGEEVGCNYTELRNEEEAVEEPVEGEEEEIIEEEAVEE